MTILLVVDDDPENIRALQNVLEAAGYEVVSAADGVDAFEELRRVSPSCSVDGLADAKYGRMDVLPESASHGRIRKCACDSSFR